MISDEPVDNLTDEPVPQPPENMEGQPAPAPPLNVQVTAPDKGFFPDLDKLQSIVLKQGPRSRKEAKYSVIRSHHTGEVHHAALSIQTYRKKAGTWSYDRDHTITLSSEGEDEIQKLIDFLHKVRGGAVPRQASESIVVPAPAEVTEHEAVEAFLKTLSASGKGHLLAELLRNSAHQDGVLEVLALHADREPQLFTAAAALKLALAAIESALGHPPESQAAGQVSQQTTE